MADLATVRKAQREHEVFTAIRIDEPWMRCRCGKQIVEVQAHWSDDAPFTITTGKVNSTQVFPTWVHADGTARADEWGNRVPEYNVVSKCGKCGALDTLSTIQEAYGDRVTCSECGNVEWYSIGD